MVVESEAKARAILDSKPKNTRLEKLNLVARLSAFDHCFVSNEDCISAAQSSRGGDDYSMSPSSKRQRLKSIMKSAPFSCEVSEATVQDRLGGAFDDLFGTATQNGDSVLTLTDSKNKSSRKGEADSSFDISAIVNGDETTASQTQVERSADRTVKLYMLQYVSKSVGTASKS